MLAMLAAINRALRNDPARLGIPTLGKGRRENTSSEGFLMLIDLNV